MTPIDVYFNSLAEPEKSCLLFLRNFILHFDENIKEVWKYQSPFYTYKNKAFAYLWVYKKTNTPVLGILKGNQIEHAKLEKGDRKLIKVIKFNANYDLPIQDIQEILHLALNLFQ